MKINHIRIFFLTGIICAAFSASFAYEYSSPKIWINWQKGYVLSRGEASVVFENGIPVDEVSGCAMSLNRARESAYSDAREDALIALSEGLKSMRVDSMNSLADIMKNSPETQIAISYKINHNVRFKNNPSGFDSSVCDARLDFADIIETIPYDFPGDDFPVRSDIPISTPYTGLVIDCRGMEISPMLFPSVYSIEGLEIYGRNFIDGSFAAKGGMVSYCDNEEKAMTDARAGEHPYYAAAVKSIKNCPVISEKDTRRILADKKTLSSLKKCRVVFIIDMERY